METVDVLSPSVADASVRPATAGDLPAIGAIHARAWTTAYRELVPASLLPSVTPDAMAGAWRPHLQAAGRSMHHLLVACTGPTVVGFAAFGPVPEDPEQERLVAAGDAELPTLLIDPTHQRRGHGSRLLAAGVDLLREDAATRLVCWVPDRDEPRLAFLRSAGFAEDGAVRRLTLASSEDRGSDPAAGTDGGSREQGMREVRLVATLAAPE